MPQYTYECEKHGQFQKLLSITEHQDTKPCPKCGTSSPQVIEQTAPPILKGRGFHANEYGAPYRGK